jgi:hypothetical protein
MSMLCSVCNQRLAESETGRKAHMARYHAVNLPIKPHSITKEEKEATIRRFESRNSSLFNLDREESIEHTVLLPDGKVQIYSAPRAIKTWDEFNARLDILVEQSDQLLQQLKEKFGE